MFRTICVLVMFSVCSFCFADGFAENRFTEPDVLAWHAPAEREQQLFDLINEQRVKSGLEPLIFAAEIFEGSREWAMKLHGERRLYHWHGGKENCARGYSTPEAAFRGWRTSSGHNAFLHNRSIRYAAVAEHENYWVFRGAVTLDEYRERAYVKVKAIGYTDSGDVQDTPRSYQRPRFGTAFRSLFR